MPKTWSNKKMTGPIPVSLDAKQRRNGAAPFVIVFIVVAIIFVGIMTMTMIRTYQSPPKERYIPAQQPEE